MRLNCRKFQLKILFFSAYFLFLFLNCCVNVNFLFVAQKWERLMNQWNRLNRELKSLMIVDMNTKSTNASTLRWFFILFISTALNYVMLTLSQGLFILSTCFEPHQHELLGESFFHQLFPDFFKVIPFHISLGILVLAIDSFLHVAWVFNDSFIIIVSLTIAKTFEIFNHKLKLNLMVSRLIENFALIISFNSNFQLRTHRKNFGLITSTLIKS